MIIAKIERIIVNPHIREELEFFEKLGDGWKKKEESSVSLVAEKKESYVVEMRER